MGSQKRSSRSVGKERPAMAGHTRRMCVLAFIVLFSAVAESTEVTALDDVHPEEVALIEEDAQGVEEEAMKAAMQADSVADHSQHNVRRSVFGLYTSRPNDVGEATYGSGKTAVAKASKLASKDAKKKLPSALEPKKPKKKVDAYTSGGVKAAEKKDQKKDDTLNFGLQMSFAFGNTITRVGAKLAKSKGGSPEQGALKLQIDELEQARMKACNSVLGLDKKKAVAEQKYGSGAISKQKAATAKLDQKAALKKGKLTPTKGDAEKAKPVAAKKEDAQAPAKKAAAKPKEMTEQRMLQLYRQTIEDDEEDSADLGASLALGGLYTSRPSNVGEATYGGAAGSGSGKGSAKPKKKDEEKKDKKDEKKAAGSAKKKAAGSGKKKAAGSAKKKPAASEKK